MKSPTPSSGALSTCAAPTCLPPLLLLPLLLLLLPLLLVTLSDVGSVHRLVQAQLPSGLRAWTWGAGALRAACTDASLPPRELRRLAGAQTCAGADRPYFGEHQYGGCFPERVGATLELGGGRPAFAFNVTLIPPPPPGPPAAAGPAGAAPASSGNHRAYNDSGPHAHAYDDANDAYDLSDLRFRLEASYDPRLAAGLRGIPSYAGDASRLFSLVARLAGHEILHLPLDRVGPLAWAGSLARACGAAAPAPRPCEPVRRLQIFLSYLDGEEDFTEEHEYVGQLIINVPLGPRELGPAAAACAGERDSDATRSARAAAGRRGAGAGAAGRDSERGRGREPQARAGSWTWSPAAAAAPPALPPCSRADFRIGGAAHDGRWVHRPGAESAPVTDEMGYNDGYLWQPHACALPAPLGPAGVRGCFAARNITRLGFSTADSLGREMFTNFVQLMSTGRDACPLLDGRALKPHAEEDTLDLPLPPDSEPAAGPGGRGPPAGRNSSLTVVRSIEVRSRVDAMLIEASTVRPLVDAAAVTLADFVRGDVLDVVERCARALGGPGRCVLLLNPAVHRQDPRVRLRQHALDQRFKKIRPASHARVVAAVRAAAAARFGPDLRVVDAEALTAARWDATWDGTHYTRSVGNDFRAQGFRCQWQGGASAMATAMFLHALCAA